MGRSRITIHLLAGDSLTEGVYGESYVERVAKALYTGQHGLKGEVVNAGREGDTAKSLLRRIDRSLRRHQPHWLILAIGGNDVWYPWLSSHSIGWWLWLQYRRVRSGQSPATDLDQFATTYRALIDRARQVRAKVLACTVSPLGERLSSPVNGRVARLNGVIKHVAADCQVPVADVWQAFVNELAPLPSHSGYLSAEWLFAWSDRRRMQKQHPDEVAERRRLHLTFDGIHLNSRGADLWAETVLEALAQIEGASGVSLANLGRQWHFPCFEQGPLEVCYTSGWESRARDLARLLGEAPLAHTLRFVAFVNEEPPYFLTDQMGSRVYARQAARRGDNIVAMYFLETMGYYRSTPNSQRYPFPFNLFYPDRGDFIGFVVPRDRLDLAHRKIGLDLLRPEQLTHQRP